MKRTLLLAVAFLVFAALPYSLAEASGASLSHNWSGYALSGSNFSAIAGSWTVASASASQGAKGDATWVGIGGLNTGDLIQVGTRAYSKNGTISYEAWYEVLPATSVFLPLTISAGDRVAASLDEVTSGVWRIGIEDLTSGNTYATTVTYNSSGSSAEWIEEMPKISGTPISLINFGSVNFSNLSAVEGGSLVFPLTAGAKRLVLVDTTGIALATPSPLAADSFSVVRN